MFDNLLITTPTNIRYLTGFVGVEERDAYLLLLPTKTFLFVSPLYKEEATKAQLNNSFLQKHFPKIKSLDICILSSNNKITKQLQTICEKEHIKTLAFESENLTVSEYEMFNKTITTLSPTQNRIENLRMKKFPKEIESINKAAKLTDECFTFIQTKIQKDITESELTWEIESFFRKNGAQLAFSPIVAFGKNSSQPHYNPTTTGPFDSAQGEQSGILQKQDVALFDFGAKIDGYCADMTRMIFVGKPKSEWIKSYDAVLKAQTAALDLLTQHFHLSINESGAKNKCIEVNGAEIDQASRKIIDNAGLPTYPHSLGHGVGLDIHESPRLTIHQDATLTADMVITIEPATYLTGKYGIRIEDLVLITTTGIEVLSKSSKNITILTC